ncbi:MAG: hypothetical protein EBW21_04640, partial [Actinobacteria bacterium]|nr:hypothetical protein [Actinomycetota bacterium]
LDSSYTSVVSDIADYEAKFDGEVKALTSSPVADWKPTYLNPFTAPQVLQVKDLPEGQYAFSLRVRDLSGLWSPWSDAVNVNIDRAYPIVGSLYQVDKVNSHSIQVQLSDTKDDGSGLCTTQLVNEKYLIAWAMVAQEVSQLLRRIRRPPPYQRVVAGVMPLQNSLQVL